MAPAPLDSSFAALSDGTRRAILERLRQGEATVSELARPFAISLPGLHKHLRVLEGAGLVESHKHGRTRHVRLRAQAMQSATDYLDAYRNFWSDRLDALGTYLDAQTGDEVANEVHLSPDEHLDVT